jgi:hypothetical protein
MRRQFIGYSSTSSMLITIKNKENTMSNSSHIKKSLLLPALLSLAGCASWFNPYIGISEEFSCSSKKNPDGNTDNTNRNSNCIQYKSKYYLSYDKAVAYARTAEGEYVEAAANLAKLSTGMGSLMIPLAAAGTGIGITSGSATALTALGLSGAAGYGMGTWLGDKSRQSLYLQAAEATVCAVKATSPLGPLNTNPALLTDELNVLSNSIAEVKNEINRAEAKECTPDERQLREAKLALDDATKIYQDGARLSSNALYVGSNLVNAVDAIKIKLNKMLATTQPELGSVEGIINGITQNPYRFGKAPSKASEVQAPNNKSPVQGTACAMAVHVNRMVQTSQEIKLGVAQVAEQMKGASSLDACSTSIAAQTLNVDPGSITLTSGEKQERTVQVSGGKPLYQANFVGNTPPDGSISVEQVIRGGSYLIVLKTSGDKALPSGEYQLSISDSSGRVTPVTITVVEPPKK